ncbi:MAG TPA: hypothetical protein VK427_18065, partial [Kofleriaceae bacterium]|nr:hypothetical protein [Kofleriaceae bacterium]
VQAHAQGISEGAISHLRDTIDERLGDQMKDARKHARDGFTQKPKKFAKRVVKSIKRDLEPDDDHARDGEDIERAID